GGPVGARARGRGGGGGAGGGGAGGWGAGGCGGGGGAGGGLSFFKGGAGRGRRPPPAVFGRPVDAAPTPGGELRLPRSSPPDLVVDRRERRRMLDVVGQPRAHLSSEGLLVVGEAEVHYRSQNRSRW